MIDVSNAQTAKTANNLAPFPVPRSPRRSSRVKGNGEFQELHGLKDVLLIALQLPTQFHEQTAKNIHAYESSVVVGLRAPKIVLP